MKSYAILLSTVAVLAAPALTHATTVTFTGYGTALPPGETLVTDFSSGLPSTFSGTASVVSGSVAGSYAAPAFSSTTVDTGPYLAIEGDAPRAEISLAYRRSDRFAAVQNFVAVARAVRLAAQSKSYDFNTPPRTK